MAFPQPRPDPEIKPLALGASAHVARRLRKQRRRIFAARFELDMAGQLIEIVGARDLLAGLGGERPADETPKDFPLHGDAFHSGLPDSGNEEDQRDAGAPTIKVSSFMCKLDKRVPETRRSRRPRLNR